MTDEALSAVLPPSPSNSTTGPGKSGSVDSGPVSGAIPATPHRYLCTGEMPNVFAPHAGHRHICQHEADPYTGRHVLARVEHSCGGCAATWTQLQPAPRPAPVDLSWVTTEPEPGSGPWVGYPILAGILAVALLATVAFGLWSIFEVTQ